MNAVNAPKAEAPTSSRPLGFLASRAKPIVYLNVPKSGCTTIKNILQRLDSGEFLADPLTIHSRSDLLLRAAREPDAISERLGRDVVFTFVRHPMRRSYSCFNEKIHFQGKYSFGRARTAIERNYGARFSDIPSLEQHRANFKCFLRFAWDSFRGTNGWRRDPHWCPQSMVLRNAQKWRMLDFIGRVERFDEHLSVALGLAGISYDFDVPRMNEGPKPPFPYDDIMDDELRSMGQAFFKGDLRNFGYSM